MSTKLNVNNIIHPKKASGSADGSLLACQKILNQYPQWQPNCPVVTVVGTNGKGTACAVLSALLGQLNKKVACFTSPHLHHVYERFQINNKNIPAHLYDKYTQECQCIAKKIIGKELGFFACATLVAMRWFAQQNCDVWIMEAGIGGLFDSVNVLSADVVILTSIALDHCDSLGSTREEIAQQKLGVTREHSVLIHADPAPTEFCLQWRNKVFEALYINESFGFQINSISKYQNQTQSLANDKQEKIFTWWYGDKQISSIPVPGWLRPENVCAALMAASVLIKNKFIKPVKTSDFLNLDNVTQALCNVRCAGRQQQIQAAGRNWWFDVAHNPASSQALADRLRISDLDGLKPRVFIMAWRQGKQVQQACQPFIHLDSKWMLADDLGADMLKSSDIAPLLPSISMQSGQSIALLREAIAVTELGDTIVVFGSFRLVSAGLQWMATLT